MLHQLPDITGTGSAVALSSAPLRVNWLRITTNSTVHTNSSVVRVGDANVSATQGTVVGINDAKDLSPASATNSFDLSQTYVLVASGDQIQLAYNQI